LKNGKFLEGPAKNLAQLSWRHYHIYWSMRFAVKSLTESNLNIAEASTFDGLSINFVIHVLEDGEDQLLNFDVSLYDAWE
jgi:hypothetical protein